MVFAAAVLLVVNFLVELVFGFGACAGDTTPTPRPGSALERYCNADSFWLVVWLPPALVLVVGLVAALRRRGTLALAAVVLVSALSVAVHRYEWALPQYDSAGTLPVASRP